jgi:iron complex outermembrane receptor protein
MTAPRSRPTIRSAAYADQYRAAGSPPSRRASALLWQPIKELAFYGNYVEGFGVPNVGSLGVTGARLRAETSQQWEAGIKTELFDGRWTATLSWFELTKQNVATGHPDPVLAALGFSVQTGEARNKGVELDVAGEVLRGWM